ncbi:MurR/RpiR family transcriptional regulator [Furfurilactobacillus rossiae]|uniref:Transcriptional regulator, RpiR family n=1 Tax=Furfurilactobacillus rossiae DSM 15814 TaxID=1114972 RepID=A0A0R1RMA5_9LACO|nr:MurR/RpiR family transcriptional regulator [Furfurilactobacillus rossiae]KRL54520.1 transcriptional regulator, RpiR family [Furfurilactobacillus rossiae DSM 15814]QFR67366.1 SIS domain-containing protein [Furfurilactobacillus rossiae]QLE60305.1 Transcriptional regulator RpiR [Furfurilactobacillus rossiae]
MELNIFDRIKDIYPSLGRSSKSIADYFLANQTNASSKTVTELAGDCHVSVATISRFAKQLGYTNYSQLKWALSNQMSKSAPTIQEVADTDTPKMVAKKTLDANIETLNGTFDLMDEKDLEKAVNLIVHAKKLEFFGLGGSNIVALDAYHKFLRVPLNVLHDTEYHLALMQASRMSDSDCAVVISHTGNDTDTLEIAEALKSKHVPIIIITSFPNSPLAEYGNVDFFSISEDSRYRSEALLSLTSQLAINDCLYMLTAQYFGKSAETVLDEIRSTISKKHPA